MQKGLIVHAVIFNDLGEALILQRSKRNDVLPEYWDLPGGTLEDGEDPLRGAIRETKEETGLEVTDMKLFFHQSEVDTFKNKQFITLIFHTHSTAINIMVNPDEHDTHAWIDPKKISTYKTVDYLPDCLRVYCELNIKSRN